MGALESASKETDHVDSNCHSQHHSPSFNMELYFHLSSHIKLLVFFSYMAHFINL